MTYTMSTRMNTHRFVTQLSILIVIALLAGSTHAANPYAGPSATAPSNNTDILINTGTTPQVKQGGLSVGTFNALANAAFEQLVYVRGLMLGTPDPAGDPTLSTLSVGGTGVQAHLSVAGTTRATEGLYSQQVATGSGTLSPLCSTTNGNIVLCPTTPPPPPPTTSHIIKGKLSFQCTDYFTWHPWPTPVDYHQGVARLSFNFPTPTPTPLSLRIAVCQDNWPFKPNTSPVIGDGCSGPVLIPGGAPSGYTDYSIQNEGPGLTFTIPQGVTSYTVPQAPAHLYPDGTYLTCSVHPSNHPRRQNTANVTKFKYLYVKNESSNASLWTLQFIGDTYQPNLTQPYPINISII